MELVEKIAPLGVRQMNLLPVDWLTPYADPRRFRHIVRFLMRVLQRVQERDSMPFHWMVRVARVPSCYSPATVQYVSDFLEADKALETLLVRFEPQHVFELEAENAVLKQKLKSYEKDHHHHF